MAHPPTTSRSSLESHFNSRQKLRATRLSSVYAPVFRISLYEILYWESYRKYWKYLKSYICIFYVDASKFTDLAIAIGNEDELQFHGFLSRSLEKDREGSKEPQRLILTLQQSFCLSFIAQTNEIRENWRLLSFPQRFYGFGQ